MNPIQDKRIFEVPLPVPSTEKRRKFDFSHIPKVPDRGWFDYTVSVTTDELEIEETFIDLRRNPIERDTVIGVSGLFALDIAVQRGDLSLRNIKKIENVVIVDCSLRVWHFWQQVGKIVRRCQLRKTVIARIKTLIREQALFYYSEGYRFHTAFTNADMQAKRLQERIDEGFSWLSTEEYFQKGKKLFDEGHIYTVLSDITQIETLKGVIKEVSDGGHSVDTLYISDIFPSKYDRSQSIKNSIPQRAYIVQALPFPTFSCEQPVFQKVFTVTGNM